MKIAIPTVDDQGLAGTVAEHFGQAAFHTIVDTETEEVRATANKGQHFGGAERPAEVIMKSEVDVVLCASLGRRAVKLFQDGGVAVFSGAQGKVQAVLDAYRDGNLQPATEESACWGHEHEE